MLRSKRGAARVSAVWMICVGVFALIALAFGFVSQSDKKKVEDSRVAAVEDKAAAEARADEANEKRRDVSVVLGWVDPTSADPESDVDAAEEAINNARAIFEDISDADTTFEAVLPKIIDAYNKRGTEINTLKARITTLENDVRSANSAVAEVTSAKDARIAELTQQVANDADQAQARQKELEDRLDGLRTQLSDRDNELRTTKSDFAEQVAGLEKRSRNSDALITSLRDKTKFADEEFATRPDGSVLEASRRTGIAWLDIGANQRVARGMVFEVQGGLPGRMTTKCTAQVTKVDANRSQVKLGPLADPLDYVQPGDVVVNPLFDPTGSRNAVLAGSFADYTRTELESLLAGIGVQVQDEVDNSTHFLIKGDALYNDPETGEPLEEPIPVSELPEAKSAEALKVLQLSLADVRTFFRFD